MKLVIKLQGKIIGGQKVEAGNKEEIISGHNGAN